jgi:hypothetical protein
MAYATTRRNPFSLRSASGSTLSIHAAIAPTEQCFLTFQITSFLTTVCTHATPPGRAGNDQAGGNLANTAATALRIGSAEFSMSERVRSFFAHPCQTGR